MKKHLFKFTVFALLAITFISCKDDDVEINDIPVIESMSANKKSNIVFGEQITANIIASDKDNSELYYLWVSDDGSIANETGRNISWTAPQKVGKYTLSCTVSDEKESVTQSIELEVVGSYFYLFDKASSSWGYSSNVTNLNLSDGIVTVSATGDDPSTFAYKLPTVNSRPYSIKTTVALNTENYSDVNIKTTSLFLRFESSELSRIQFQIAPGSRAWNVIAYKSDGTSEVIKRTENVDIFTANDQFRTIGMAITANKMLVVNIDKKEIARVDLSKYDSELTLERFYYYTSSIFSLLIDDFYLTTDDTILK